MELKVHSDDGGVLRLSLTGRIAMAVLAEESEAISRLLGDRGYTRSVLLSLEHADSIDSAGLSWLVVNHKRFLQSGGSLVVHSIPFNVMEILKMMRLDRVLTLAEDESKAMELVRGDAG